jgi:SHS2 domain-containing protein
MKKSQTVNFSLNVENDKSLLANSFENLQHKLEKYKTQNMQLKSDSYIQKTEIGILKHERDIWFEKYTNSQSELFEYQQKITDLKNDNIF